MTDDDDDDDTNSDDDMIATFFLVCSVDGSIVAVNAANGDILSFLHTHRPLVGASHPQHIVPGLDGTIYQYHRNDDDDDDDYDFDYNDDASSDENNNNNDELFVLPMTVEDVLHHPVRTCTSSSNNNNNNHRDCGIVTGTKLTHLYAFNGDTKQLQWTQKEQQQQQQRNDDDASSSSSSSSSSDTCDESANVVLLQREDFVVKSISASTGREAWNITLGRFSALEFDAQQQQQHVDGYLAAETAATAAPDASHAGETPEHASSSSSSSSSTPSTIPSIAFGKEGKTLTAIASSPSNAPLWRRRWHAVIASVYGVRGATWVPLAVVDEPEELLAPTESAGAGKELLHLPSASTMGSSNHHAFGESFEKQTYMDLLWNEIQQLAGRPHRLVADMVVYPDPDFSHVDCTVRDAASGLCLLGRNPKRPQLLLLSSGVDPPMPSPLHTTSSGVFVTYPMAAGMVLVAALAAFALRVLYLRKKRQWLAHAAAAAASRRTLLSRSWHEGAAQHLSLDPRRLLSDAPATMTRSLSMPMFEPDGDHFTMRPSQEATRVHSAPKKAGETESPSTSAEPTMRPSNVGHIDGIPLVRYSRYRSEFRELSALGRGGFGSVFRCVNQLDGREYAIKKVHIQSEVDENGIITKEFLQRLQRVLREVKILAMLDHVNVVRYYTAWLELEGEGQGEVDNSMATISEYAGNTMTQDDSKMSRCYSSELLTGASRSPTAGRRPPFSPQRRAPSTANPLGWNDSPSDCDESLRRVRLPMEDETDCGFTFEATETSLGGAAADDDQASIARRLSGILPMIPDDMSAREKIDVAGHASSVDISASLSLEEEMDTNNDSKLVRSTRNKSPATKPTKVRHTLYIQMQLCSQRTLGDFLATPDARKGSMLDGTENTVDIPRALGLFFQVAQAVRHVHEQGLIHRYVFFGVALARYRRLSRD
jgi:serine/threonine protein kinase